MIQKEIWADYRDRGCIYLKYIVMIMFVMCILHVTVSYYIYSSLPYSEVFFKIEHYLFLCFALLIPLCLVRLFVSIDRKEFWNYIKSLLCKEQILLIAMFVLSVLSVIVSYPGTNDNWVSMNKEYLFDFGIAVFIFFPLGRYLYKYDSSKIIKFLFRAFIVLNSLLMIWIIVAVFQHKTIQLLNNCEISMGQQLQINCNPNRVGMYMLIVFFVSILASFYVSGILKYIYWFSAVICFLILLLSNSRASFIGTVCGIALAVGIYFFSKMQCLKLWQRWCILIGTMVISAVLLILFRSLFFTVYESTFVSETTVIRDLDPTSTSGRIDIWIKSIKTVFSDAKSILIGASPAGTSDAINIYVGTQKIVNSHNQFIEIALATGIPGLIVFIIWTLFLAKNCIFLDLNKNIAVDYKIKFATVIILAIMVNNLAEARLFYSGQLMGVGFAVLAGWVTSAFYSAAKNTAK